MDFFTGLGLSYGANLLGNIFGGIFGRRRSAPREDPRVAYLREMTAKMLGRGLEEAEYLIPILRAEAESERKRYLENYGAYKQSVSRLNEMLTQPFLPVRDTLTRVANTERAMTMQLLRAGLSPALATAVAKINSEKAYMDTVEQMRQTKLAQQVQATNAVGSLLGYSSAPMTALSALSGLASSLSSGGMGGYSQALGVNMQQRALDEQRRQQNQNFMGQMASMLGGLLGKGGGFL